MNNLQENPNKSLNSNPPEAEIRTENNQNQNIQSPPVEANININQVENNPPKNINEIKDNNNTQNNPENINAVEPPATQNVNPSNIEERRNDNIPGNNIVNVPENKLPFKIEDDYPSGYNIENHQNNNNVQLNENRNEPTSQPCINTENNINLLSNVIDSNKAIPEPSQKNMNSVNPLEQNNISQPLVNNLEQNQNNAKVIPNQIQPNPSNNKLNSENNQNQFSDISGYKPINPEPLQGDLNQILSGQIDINNSNSKPPQNSQVTEPNNNQNTNPEEEEKIEFASQIQSFNNNENQNQNPTLSQIIKNE